MPAARLLHNLSTPSVLVELAYISNASDRRRLAGKRFRRLAADALGRAITAYLADRPLEPVAGEPYPRFRIIHVRPGDTLQRLGLIHGVPVAELKRLNGIADARKLQAGQRLILPGKSR